MRLTDILQPDCVVVPLEASNKQEAIFSLANVLVTHTPIADLEELKSAIWQRESARTTGIGHGIGIPHGKAKGVDQLRMAIGCPVKPVDFNAIDGKPVDLIILLASPLDQTGPHIQALAKISRMLTDEPFRVSLKQAGTAEKIYQMIVDFEARHAGV